MFSSLRIGRAFGIDMFIHWTFWLLPASLVLLGTGGEGAELALNLTVLAAAFGCVLLHELGHALTARQFGVSTRDITLYPIGGVARLERMPERPAHELWIALAGPAVNLVIGAFLITVLMVMSLLDPTFMLGTAVGLMLFRLLIVNVMLVLFNLLPAFPMDGGRVLRALLAMGVGNLQATKVAAGVGVGMAALIGLVGIFLLSSPWLVVIALFVFVAGQAELQAAYLREQRAQLEDEPPALQPLTDPSIPFFYMQPRVTVYTWDAETQTWVKEPSDRRSRSL
ncbi:MAG: site-2 protease family protein [Gemmataceae bacterium]|nr:site-2 protease family protein [Gemmataceae bacterium]